jgi:glycosyltransferase involved in cell wall biosynthesis
MLLSPRVAVLTPFASPSPRGNAVTVARIVRGLAGRGVEARVWDVSSTGEATIEREVGAFAPSLLHAFHAFRVGPLALRLARRVEIPLVVTLTGTDANHDLFEPARARLVRSVLEGASRVTVFHASIAARVAEALPDLGQKLVTVPQATSVEPSERFDLSGRWALPADRILFVFPAGVREVKRPRFPLVPFDRLLTRQAQVRLLYAGPILDPEEGEALRRALASRPWARHVGAVPHAQMASLLAQADVVLNCSISEGGMANSVLEALAMERAVLAADIEGNRSLIEHGVTGLLFGDEAELEAGAERLAADPVLRRRLGRAGRQLIERTYPPEREIDGYLDVYRSLVPAPCR